MTRFQEILDGKSVSLDSGHLPSFLYGLDASKPASPGLGDKYTATDTGISYECFTAGTWTVVSMFQTATSVILSRALDGIYQNTSGKIMQVYGTVGSNSPTTGDKATAIVHVDTMTPPVARRQEFGVFTNATGAQIKIYFPFSFIVPINYYYQLESSLFGSGTLTLIDWVEVT